MNNFYKYPHTDLNQQNLDWLIAQMKKLQADYAEYKNPVVVYSAAEMIDKTKIYIYKGYGEGDLIYNYWYFWSDPPFSRWVAGGPYGMPEGGNPLEVTDLGALSEFRCGFHPPAGFDVDMFLQYAEWDAQDFRTYGWIHTNQQSRIPLLDNSPNYLCRNNLGEVASCGALICDCLYKMGGYDELFLSPTYFFGPNVGQEQYDLEKYLLSKGWTKYTDKNDMLRGDIIASRWRTYADVPGHGFIYADNMYKYDAGSTENIQYGGPIPFTWTLEQPQLDRIRVSGNYTFTAGGRMNSYSTTNRFFCVVIADGQRIEQIVCSDKYLLNRRSTDNGMTWSEWSHESTLLGNLPSHTDLDDLHDYDVAGEYVLQGSYTYYNLPAGMTYGLLTVDAPQGVTWSMQTVASKQGYAYRFYANDTWSNWSFIDNQISMVSHFETTITGLTITADRKGWFTEVRITGAPSSNLNTNGAFESLATLPEEFAPMYTESRVILITNQHDGRVEVDVDTRELRFGYTRNLTTNSNINFSSGTQLDAYIVYCNA